MTILRTYSLEGDVTNSFLDSVDLLDFLINKNENQEIVQITCNYGVHTLELTNLDGPSKGKPFVRSRYYLGGSSLENSIKVFSDEIYSNTLDESFILYNLTIFREKVIREITTDFLSKLGKRVLSGYFNWDSLDSMVQENYNAPCIRRGRFVRNNTMFEILLGFSIQKLFFYGRVKTNKGEVLKFDSEDLDKTLRDLSTEILYLIF